MKKLMLLAIASMMAVFTGCKSVPTTDQMQNASYAIGVATATVANMTKIDDASRNAIVEIMNEVQSCIPQTNQTFQQAWTEIAVRHTEQLVKEGKLTDQQAALVLETFKIVVEGIDYLVNIRFPIARQYQELIEAASHGFCDGFLTVFKPANSLCSGCQVEDMEQNEMMFTEYQRAYLYLKSINK